MKGRDLSCCIMKDFFLDFLRISVCVWTLDAVNTHGVPVVFIQMVAM